MAFDLARVKSLFLEASDLPSPEERAAYLDRECDGEPDLRARVEALLAVEERAGPVPEPEASVATQKIASETLAETRVLDLATVGVGREPDTLADGPSTSRFSGFVPGQVIGGRYTLLEVLGEGGMGTVYRAEQSQPVKRQVALKLIKVGMDSRTVLARFDAERQALAMMDHPNIARVYDGGATDANQPFFVMEFVDGVAITDYCDQHRLSVDARLQLFVAVCQAVQHAHQKGIIHRDIKPSNVMVTEVDGRATPKVIDFGVAKATESRLTDQTLGDTGAIVGTPTYMSPEQADPSTQDIDTRTDIYALGVILYELLAGSPPLDATQFQRGALLEMLRMVREVDPSKPSTKVSTADALPSIAANRGIDPEHLKRELRGDLDWIVMKALEKDRTRRYETANGLGADILRHLASEPVLAAPPSRSYRLRKFVRKHRVGVIAASLVVLALVAGVTGTTWGLLEARRSARAERLAKLDAQEKKTLAEANETKARAAAEEEKKAKETVEAVLGFVENQVFAAARPKGQAGGLGFDVKLVDAVTAALPFIEKGFPDKPLTEARLRMTIGDSFRYLGKPEIAAVQFEAARSLYSRHLGPDHPDTLKSMNSLAVSYTALGRHADSLKLNEEVLTLRKVRLGPDHPDTLQSMNSLANSYSELSQRTEALKLREETLALRRAKLGPDHPLTLGSLNNLAVSYTALGRHAEALKINEEVLALRKAKLGPDHPDTLVSLSNLAASYTDLFRCEEAVKLNEEALARRKATLGPDHAHTIQSMINLANSFTLLGRYDEALKLNEEVLALRKARLGPDHPDTLTSMNTVVLNYFVLGRHAEVLKLNEEALSRIKGRLGPDHPDTLRSMSNLARIYCVIGQHAEAIKLIEDAMALNKARAVPDLSYTLLGMYDLAVNYSALGRHAEAVKISEEMLALSTAKLGPDHPSTLTGIASLSNSYLDAGHAREALPLMTRYSNADPKNTIFSLKLAALQAWLGLDEELAATRQRILANARGTEDAITAERAAKACGFLPPAGKEELEAAIVLARRAVDLGKGGVSLDFSLLALGMVEYRVGHFVEAEASLSAVMDRYRKYPSPRKPQIDTLDVTASYYRAMSLFRQGKNDEARKLATEATAKMKPLPKDEQEPMASGADLDDLILWLAYKEAKALIGFDPPSSPTVPDAK